MVWDFFNGVKKIRLCEFENHLFLDEKLPINLYAIRHWYEILEYGLKRRWKIEKMMMVKGFRNGRACINTEKANARSLEVVRAIYTMNGFMKHFEPVMNET